MHCQGRPRKPGAVIGDAPKNASLRVTTSFSPPSTPENHSLKIEITAADYFFYCWNNTFEKMSVSSTAENERDDAETRVMPAGMTAASSSINWYV
jgi:phosphoserine aminotransferase